MKNPKDIYFDLCDKYIETVDRSDIVIMAMEEFATQITDEEIETESINKFGNDWGSHDIRRAWILGAKWYRDQLKKQF